jgi:hypothetical protein
MSSSRYRSSWVWSARATAVAVAVAVAAATLATGCEGTQLGDDDVGPVATISAALTGQQRLAACDQDPRVIAGLVTRQICAGAGIFFNETFNGNGRTCATCHPVTNNFTVDVPFIEALHTRNPLDPLFVAENVPALANLETSDLRDDAAILENVDGFEAPANKFVSRSVSHMLSLKTSITRDPADGTDPAVVERTGWGGDGPGDGSLRSFLAGAVEQHFTKNLARRPGIDFRVPTSLEADLALAFQLALGRLNELDLNQVNIFDPDANEGRRIFLDPLRGRCNICHVNAGANFIDTGKNRNIDSGTRLVGASLTVGVFNGIGISDAGFGGRGLAQPNVDVVGAGFPNGFGNLTFSPPPLIEAADTGPFFHNNLRITSQGDPRTIEQGILFYVDDFTADAFGRSAGGAALQARFGTRLDLQPLEVSALGRFLRVLNGALNLDMARQRLEAAMTLVNRFHDTRADIQRRLMELAVEEIDDALVVISQVNLYPVAQDRIGLAKQEIAAGLAAPVWWERQSRISNAISRVLNARDHFGANINFQLGQGNLMF